MSQQVDVGKDQIDIHLISTQGIPDARVTEVRQDLMRRTGRDVQLSVDVVASKNELADLMARLTRPAPVVAKPATFAEMQKQLLDRVRPAIQEIWPSTDAPIQDYNVILGSAGIAINVRYQAPKDLGDVPIGMVQQSLRTKLGIPGLTLMAENIPRPTATISRTRASGKRKR